MPTQKQTQGATAHDLERLMSSLVPNDLGLPLLIQIALCLLQRACTQTINEDQLMHGNLFPQCNLFRGLWLRHTLVRYQYLLSSLLNNSLEPRLSKPIFLLSAKGLWIEAILKKAILCSGYWNILTSDWLLDTSKLDSSSQFLSMGQKAGLSFSTSCSLWQDFAPEQ